MPNFDHNFFILCIPRHPHQHVMEVGGGLQEERRVSWKSLHLPPRRHFHLTSPQSPLSGHVEVTLRKWTPSVLFIRWVTRWLAPQLLHTEPAPPLQDGPPPIHSGGGGERVRFCLGPLRLLLCSLSESLQPIPVVPDPALLARLACPAPGHVRREWLGDGRVLGGLISQPDAGSPTGMSTDPLVPGSRQQSHGW